MDSLALCAIKNPNFGPGRGSGQQPLWATFNFVRILNTSFRSRANSFDDRVADGGRKSSFLVGKLVTKTYVAQHSFRSSNDANRAAIYATAR